MYIIATTALPFIHIFSLRNEHEDVCVEVNHLIHLAVIWSWWWPVWVSLKELYFPLVYHWWLFMLHPLFLLSYFSFHHKNHHPLHAFRNLFVCYSHSFFNLLHILCTPPKYKYLMSQTCVAILLFCLLPFPSVSVRLAKSRSKPVSDNADLSPQEVCHKDQNLQQWVWITHPGNTVAAQI